MIFLSNEQLVRSALNSVRTRPNRGWYCYSDADEQCMYQSPVDPTLGCFVGQAIIDAGQMTRAIAKFQSDALALFEVGLIDLEDSVFARKIQKIHDHLDNESDERVIQRILALASEYGVEMKYE